MINQWTDDELQILKDHYKSKGSKFVAEQINKSQKAVTAKAARLGLSIPLLWSDDEIKYLKRYYSRKGPKFVAAKLGKNPDSVTAKAAKLKIRFNGIRAWSPWEDNYLRRHYNNRKKILHSQDIKTYSSISTSKGEIS